MKVEISRKNGNLYTGKVKWKGYVTGRTGEWIGIELDVPGKQQLARLEMSLVLNIIRFNKYILENMP